MSYQKPLVVKSDTIQSLPAADMVGLGDFPDWETNSLAWVQTRQAFCMRAAANFAQTNQVTDTFGSLSGTGKWKGGVLAPNGMIYGILHNSTEVLKIDPINDSASTFGSLSDFSKWAGGVLAPNGMIYGIPYNSTTVLRIDPIMDTVSTFGDFSGTGKWFGGILTLGGVVYGIPFKGSMILKVGGGFNDAEPDFCLSRFFNKF